MQTTSLNIQLRVPTIKYTIKNIYIDIAEAHDNLRKLRKMFNVTQKINKKNCDKCAICLEISNKMINTRCDTISDHYYCTKCFGECGGDAISWTLFGRSY